MVRECDISDVMRIFIRLSGMISLLPGFMLPVHFDLFLYVIREKNNRLFLLKYQIKYQTILSSPGETRGGGGLSFRDYPLFQGALKCGCVGGYTRASRNALRDRQKEREKWHPGKSGNQLIS
jgi:hypothetical protein